MGNNSIDNKDTCDDCNGYGICPAKELLETQKGGSYPGAENYLRFATSSFQILMQGNHEIGISECQHLGNVVKLMKEHFGNAVTNTIIHKSGYAHLIPDMEL